jgi:hypothetical protein
MGGNGTVALSFEGWPAHGMSEPLRLYYLIELAYHVHSLGYLLAKGLGRNDAFEMMIHHVCTILLVR